MSTGQLPRFSSASGIQSTVRQRLQVWRLALLCLLLLCSIGFSPPPRVNSPVFDQPLQAFITLWLVSCIPYLVACLLVLTTQPLNGRWRWIELGLILLG